RRVKRKPDFIPKCNLTARRSIGSPVAAFQKTKVADVVNGRIRAPNGQWRFAGCGQMNALREERVEGNSRPGIPFAPHAKEAGQALAKAIRFGLIRLDCQPDGSCRACIGRTPDPPPKALPQRACHERQFAPAASYV